MRHRLAVLLVVVAALGGAGTARADDSSPAELLARFQPVTVLDVREAFAPAPVESFLQHADVQALQQDGSYTTVAQSPEASALPRRDPQGCESTSTAPWRRVDYRGCSPAAGLAAIGCYAASPGDRSVVYGR